MKLDKYPLGNLKSPAKKCKAIKYWNCQTSGNYFPCGCRAHSKNGRFGCYIGHFTKVSHFEIGHQSKAIITLSAFMGSLKPFLEIVKDFDEVVNCYRITGNENIIMEVVLNNQSHLEKLIDQLITYGETRTHIVLSNVLENNPIIKRPSL